MVSPFNLTRRILNYDDFYLSRGCVQLFVKPDNQNVKVWQALRYNLLGLIFGWSFVWSTPV